jgi:hypothetical protein
VSEAVAKADLARWRRFWRDRHAGKEAAAIAEVLAESTMGVEIRQLA